MTKICTKCHIEKDISEFYKQKGKKDGLKSHCKVCFLEDCHEYATTNKGKETRRKWYTNRRDSGLIRKFYKTYNRKLKKLVFDHYGNKCVCCGETHKEFLTIDHINGHGRQHRNEIGNSKNTNAWYRWIIQNNYPSYLRILCMNCNFSLGMYGYCPHGDLNEEKE